MPKLIDISIEQRDLARLALRFKEAEGGALLRTTLIRNLRIAVAPAVSEAKAGATAISHGGYQGGESGGSLGAAIAAGIGTQVRLTGPRVGVKVRAGKKGMPRNFKNAPKYMNQPSFEHPVYGHRGTWVVQIGNPDFFDGPMHRNKDKYREACLLAIAEAQRALI